MGPGTGNQFSSDDVKNCLSDLRFSQFLTFYMQRGDISSRFIAFLGVKISDTDECMSSDTSSSKGTTVSLVGMAVPFFNFSAEERFPRVGRSDIPRLAFEVYSDKSSPSPLSMLEMVKYIQTCVK